MGGCSAVAAPIVGGRRRRSVKKTRASRKMRGGNFYSVAADPGLGSAAAGFSAVENVPVNQDGTPKPEAVMPKVGGRRRRTSKKGKKSRRMTRRRRSMRGGAGFYSIAGVGAGYAGKGAGGLADYEGYSTKGPVAGGPTQGGDGVMKA